MSCNRTTLFVIVALATLGVGIVLLGRDSGNTDRTPQADTGRKISWQVPTANTDESPLTDLAGYTVYCWNTDGQETETFAIEDSAITTYELQGLRPGTYQCAISAVSRAGNQSALSNVVSRTIP